MATNISQAFNEFKSRLELSSTLQDSVVTHHNAIREWIESYDRNIETKLIGSLQRRTRIQPRTEDIFDIDILVNLGEFRRWVPSGGVTPADALRKVEDIVSENETYESMGPETDSPAIILEYSDNIKVELTPAYLDQIGHAPDGTPTIPIGRGYWIPKNNRWVMADYDYDADYISLKNRESNGWLIPTIKMLKAYKRNSFPEMKSYHLEVMATNWIPPAVIYFGSKGMEISYPLLVYGFFLCVKDEVLKSSIIPGSKSPDASTYMGFLQKMSLSEKFKNIGDYCSTLFGSDNSKAIEGWKKLFGDPFPSYR